MDISLPTLLTEKQVAQYLQVSEKKLQKDRYRGEGIPYVKIGHLVRYREIDIYILSSRVHYIANSLTTLYQH